MVINEVNVAERLAASSDIELGIEIERCFTTLALYEFYLRPHPLEVIEFHRERGRGSLVNRLEGEREQRLLILSRTNAYLQLLLEELLRRAYGE